MLHGFFDNNTSFYYSYLDALEGSTPLSGICQPIKAALKSEALSFVSNETDSQWQDISGDRGILKRLLREGHGDTVQTTARVTSTFSKKWSRLQPFLSSDSMHGMFETLNAVTSFAIIVHYVGWLGELDHQQQKSFCSTRELGQQPLTFQLNTGNSL